MRKSALLLLMTGLCISAFAQTAPVKKTTITRATDHLVLQFAANFWNGDPDSVSSHVKNFSRSANFYVMFDKPFKGNPKMSAAIGAGVGTSNIYFKKMDVDITAPKSPVPFIATDSTDHYKKYKLSETFLEIPVELRFMSRPATPNKSVKAAIGFKLGTLMNAHTKGKILEDSTGTKINEATVKESSKTYFNSTRLALTARFGYGIFSVFGSYSLTNVFKDNVAANTKLLQIGICISGL